MDKFQSQLSRMQTLMNYRMVQNESNDKSNIEFSKIGADGKSYAIIRECSKYYIKTADADKATLAESYEYIGGWNNKKDYEYTSYANALKNFDLKMMSLNEAYDAHGNAVSLDPSKKEEFVIEGTDAMKKELARQRQIMANAARIGLYEETHMTDDPERVAGSNDANKPYTEKGEAKLDKDVPDASGKPESESEPYGDGKAPEKGKDVKDGDVLSDGKAVATEHPTGGKVAKVNEGCEGAACAGNKEIKDWESGLNKGNGDAASVKWVEGAQEVNEEINDAQDWDKGLPGSAGVGSPAETKKHVMDEGEEDEYDVEGDEDEPAEDAEPESGEAETSDAPAEGGEEGADFDFGAGDQEPIDDLGGEEELGGEDELGDEEGGDLEERIEDLEAEIASIKAELYGEEGEEGEELSDEEPLDEPAEDLGGEDELGGEEEIDLDEPDSVDDEEPVDGETELGGEDEPADDESIDGDDFDSKEAFMEAVVNNVVNKLLNEEKTVLHDFGKHPGYRKKVMSLPPTGSDNEKGMKDWNDDSVHNEKPFGSSIGDGDPFNQTVKMITDAVLESLKKRQ